MNNRAFSFLLLILFGIGGATAYLLGSLTKLEMFKVLNIVGIIYGLLGVIILSEFVVQNEGWRRFVVDKLSGILIWAHGVIPLGAGATSLVLYLISIKQYPSSPIVGAAFMAFAFYSLLPTFFIEDYVFNPKQKQHKDPLLRIRIFGLFLVISGMIVQLIAAIQDMLNR